VPWQGDPTSLLISPLALLALVYTGKRKRSKLDVFVALMVVCGVLSLSLAGCGPSTPGDGTPIPTIETPFGYTDTPTPGTVNPSTPTPGGTPIGTLTYTCTPTPFPTPTATPLSQFENGYYNREAAVLYAMTNMTKNLSEKYLREETRHGKNEILNNPFYESASPCQRIPQNPKISIECQASYGSY